MVNSPSRPNVRPVDPPPLGASVRHPFLLPPPAPRPARGEDVTVPTILDAGAGSHLPNGGRPPGPIKAKTPVIVHNRASSRQTLKRYVPSHSAPSTERGSATRTNMTKPATVMISTRHFLDVGSSMLVVGCFPISLAIVHDQASSRHLLKMLTPNSWPGCLPQLLPWGNVQNGRGLNNPRF